MSLPGDRISPGRARTPRQVQVEDSGSPGCLPGLPGEFLIDAPERLRCRLITSDRCCANHVFRSDQQKQSHRAEGHRRRRQGEPLHAIVGKPRYHAASRAGHDNKIDWPLNMSHNHAAQHRARSLPKTPNATRSGNLGQSSARSATAQGLAKVAGVAARCETWRHQDRYGGLEPLRHSRRRSPLHSTRGAKNLDGLVIRRTVGSGRHIP